MSYLNLIVRHALASVDYSMTCPAVATIVVKHNDFILDTFDFERVEFFFCMENHKRVSLAKGNFHASPIPEYKNNEERFNNLRWWVLGCLAQFNSVDVMIEDYAFAAKGQVFNIAENTGCLKNLLWDRKIPFQKIDPKTIKKFATGSGAAKKEDMYESFFSETNCNLLEMFGQTKSDVSPISDLVDAFYLLKYHFLNNYLPGIKKE